MTQTRDVSWLRACTISLPFGVITECISVGALIQVGENMFLKEVIPVVQVYGAIDACGASLSAEGTMTK